LAGIVVIEGCRWGHVAKNIYRDEFWRIVANIDHPERDISSPRGMHV